MYLNIFITKTCYFLMEALHCNAIFACHFFSGERKQLAMTMAIQTRTITNQHWTLVASKIKNALTMLHVLVN